MTILQPAAGFTNVRRWDTLFYGSTDKYVHEFLICNMNTRQSRSMLAVNKNVSFNCDVTSELLCATACTVVMRLNHRNSVCPSVRHTGKSVKKCKTGSPNFHCWQPGKL